MMQQNTKFSGRRAPTNPSGTRRGRGEDEDEDRNSIEDERGEGEEDQHE